MTLLGFVFAGIISVAVQAVDMIIVLRWADSIIVHWVVPVLGLCRDVARVELLHINPIFHVEVRLADITV